MLKFSTVRRKMKTNNLYMKFLTCLFIFCFIINVFPQSIPNLIVNQKEIEFDHLFFEDQYDNFAVEDILKDDYGFIWVATKNGLYRYDGINLTDISDYFPELVEITGRSFLSLCMDDNSMLYALTVTHVFKINTVDLSAALINLEFDKNSNIGNVIRGEIYLSGDSLLYAGLWNGGILVINLKSGKSLHIYDHNSNAPGIKNIITSIIHKDEKSLWIATHDGLYSLGHNSKHLKRLNVNHILQEQDEPNRFNALKKSNDGILWIGTDKGLVSFNPSSGKSKTYLFSSGETLQEDNNLIESIDFTTDNKIWVGSRYGLHLLDPHTGEYRSFMPEKNNPSSIQSNYVRKVFFDDHNILWIGYHDGSISKYTPRKKNFSTYTINSDFTRDLRVFSIFKEKDLLWFGTETGLYKYHITQRELKQYTHNPNNKNSLSHNLVSGIQKSSDGKLYITTDKGGIDLFDPKNGTFTSVTDTILKRYDFQMADIWSSTMDQKDNLWCGTGGAGLLHLNTLTNEIRNYKKSEHPKSLSGNFIGPVQPDEKNMLWVGTSKKGLNYFNPRQDTAMHFTTSGPNHRMIVNETIISLCLTSGNKLWVGTATGISIINTENFLVDNITAQQLKGYSIEGILEDINENIWISTNRGLYFFDRHKKTFHKYYVSDGISSNRFISGSVFKADDGYLLFGSYKGITAFYPWEIKNNQRIPQIIMTDIKVFEESIQESLNQYVNNAGKSIRLNHQQKDISFHFAAMDFYDIDKNTYQYMLKGYDKDWGTLVNKNTVSYNNLSPGNYTFMLRASNNDNIWNKEGIEVSFQIIPPFYQTILFRIALLVIISVGIYLLILFRLKNIKSQKLKLEHIVEERTFKIKTQKEALEVKHRTSEKQKLAIEHQAVQLASINKTLEKQQKEIQNHAKELKAVNKLKSRFFANISHEFRTPLTLILNSIDDLKQSTGSGVNNNMQQKNFNVISKNSQRLLRLINQLLDLTRIDSGHMKLKISRGNIHSFVHSIVNAFTQKAYSSNITLNYTLHTDMEEVFLDWDKLEKIFYNLISNALKFSKDKGTVDIVVKCWKEDYILFEITDNGIGIPLELHDKIFSRFYRAEQTEMDTKPGTGIGLALTKELVRIHKGKMTLESDIGKGTTFRIVLPCVKKRYSPEEILLNNEAVLTNFDYDYLSSTTDSIDLADDNNTESFEETRVLFIDDNTELCEQVKNQLQDKFKIIIATNGKQGFEKAIDYFPDIIVSDLAMPKLSGVELCDKIKSDVRTDHIPFIILTARKDDESLMQALAHGADDYIAKPFAMKMLILKIRNILQTRNLLKQKLSKEFHQKENLMHDKFSNSFLNTAVEIINKNIENETFDVNELAKEMNISRTQLYRKFNGLITISVNDFIKDIKLKKAKRLLSSNEYNVSEVAALSGFKTPGYFSSCFVEKFGILPSKFLNNLKNKKMPG